LIQSFIRCPHCGMPHMSDDVVCPATGKPLDDNTLKAAAKAASDKVPARTGSEKVAARTGSDKAPVKSAARAPAVTQGSPTSAPVLEVSASDDGPVSRRSGPRSLRLVLQSSKSERPPPPRQLEDLTGVLVDGKYQVTGILGAGGMGKVYEAEHVALGRHVALKVLQRDFLQREDALARFHREARAAGSIGHPNICEVYDVGYLSDFSPYMVMELLRGTTLANRLEHECFLPVPEVFDIITQILSALVAAHAKGIIHRDIKPENVFLAERVGCPAVVKLLDFGIVKQNDELELTHAGTIMGTPFYMAPELLKGAKFDHRIDLYACGVMLFEMLTGVLPFEAQHYHTLAQKILKDEPPDVTELRHELSVSWLPVIDKALAKDPAKRYRDAKDFLAGLEDLKAGLALRRSVMVPASPPPPSREEGRAPDSEDIDIPVVQSVRSEDLVEPIEPAPDTAYDPAAQVAAAINLESSDAWEPPALSSRDEPSSDQPLTPLLERYDDASGYDATRPAAESLAPEVEPTVKRQVEARVAAGKPRVEVLEPKGKKQR
jgi:eukaryotic-like serine/threonine-protein kinase